jgi:hypothetical protein
MRKSCVTQQFIRRKNFMGDSSTRTTKAFIRSLLAGTCLTAATAAHASIIESGNNFPQTLAAALASPLPIGTTDLSGSVADGTGVDYVDFMGLQAGAAFDLHFTPLGALSISVLNSAGSSIGTPGSPQPGTSPVDVTGTVPNDGQLVAFINNTEGSTYSINLSAPLGSPEPGSSALAGLGLAAASMLAARRRKQSR